MVKEKSLREKCFARGHWHWMTSRYEEALAWCEKNVRSRWYIEVDAAAFAFKSRSAFDRFRKEFPQ